MVGNMMELKSPIQRTVQTANNPDEFIVTINNPTLIKPYNARSFDGLIISCKPEPINQPTIAPPQ